MVETLVGSVIAPGIVAALVTYILNRQSDAKRRKRDYTGKYIDDARDEVRAAALLGVRYHANISVESRDALASEISIYEADLRNRLAEIRRDESADNAALIFRLRLAEEEFVDALTGGQFGSASATSDPVRVSRTVAAATILRGHMRDLRVARMDEDIPTAMWPSALLVFVVCLYVFLIGVAVGASPS